MMNIQILKLNQLAQEEFISCIYSKRLLDKLEFLNIDAVEKIDICEIKKAIFYTKYYHYGQKRDSGEDYYTHPLEVAYMVSDYIFRTDIIVTAILHDTIEDTALTKQKIESAFGKHVAEQVYDLTRIREDGKKISSEDIIISLHIQEKKDLIVIKLFDRLHNIQTIGAKPPDKAKKMLQETIRTFLVFSIEYELVYLEEELKKLCMAF